MYVRKDMEGSRSFAPQMNTDTAKSGLEDYFVYVNVGEHNSYSSATLSSCVGGSVCSSIQNLRIFFPPVPASTSMCMPWRQPLEPDGSRPSQRVFKNMGRKAWHQSSPSANLLQCIFEPNNSQDRRILS